MKQPQPLLRERQPRRPHNRAARNCRGALRVLILRCKLGEQRLALFGCQCRNPVVEVPHIDLDSKSLYLLDVGQQPRQRIVVHLSYLLLHDCQRKTLDRRTLEERAQPQVDTKRLAHARHDFRREHRVAAQMKEVVPYAHAIDAEHGGPNRGNLAFRAIARRQHLGLERAVHFEGRQRPPQQLPAWPKRHRIEAPKGCRHHVVGQRRGTVGSQPVSRRFLQSRGRHVSDQALVSGVSANRNRCGADAGTSGQDRLNFTKLDPAAAQLDLVVGSAQKLNRAVRPASSSIAGAIEAAARRAERIGNEPLRGQRGLVEISTANLNASDVQITLDADRHRLQMRIEHVQ